MARKSQALPSIPGLLRHARHTYADAMRHDLQEAGFGDIPRNGLYVLGGLLLGNGEIPLAQLIQDLRITKQAAGQLVDALVLRGYLERSVDPNDRRRLVVGLTERGRSAARVQGQARDRIDTALARRIGRTDVEAFRRALMVLIGIGRPNEGEQS